MTWAPVGGMPTAANDPRWHEPVRVPTTRINAPWSQAQKDAAHARHLADRRACALTVELTLAQIRAKAAGRKIPDRPLL